MCEVIPMDELPDCDSCHDPSKRIIARTIDLDGPGKFGFLYDCGNTVCRRKRLAVGALILRQDIYMKGGEGK